MQTRPTIQTPKNSSLSVRCSGFEPSSSALVSLLLSMCLLASAAIGQSAAPATAIDSEPWTLGERAVKAPTGASDDVRSAIAAAPAPNVQQRKQMPAMSDEQWLGMQKGSSQADLAAVAKQYQVKVEKKEIGGVTVYGITPQKVSPEHEGHLFLHLHGGGYVLGGGDAVVSEAAVVSGGLGINAISVDYRMPPQHPFPTAIEDAISVYRELTRSQPAASIAIGGTSAGGGLSLAVVHKIRSLKLDPPGAIWAGTPWADLTKTGDTLFTNEGLDRILVTYDGMIEGMAKLYAGGHDLKDPLISPVYGDFEGFPPTQFVTGTRDMFLSDTARTHRKMRAAGVTTDLNVYEGLSHAEYFMIPGSPEERQVVSDLHAFLVQHLP